MHSEKLRCTVLVVGAGPVGLLSALFLSQQDINVVVIESEPKIPDSPRAVVYLPQTLPTLDKAGILEEVKSTGRVVDGGPCWRRTSDHRLLARLDHRVLGVDDKPDPQYRQAILLEQHRLADIVLKRLESLGTRVLFNHTFQSLTQNESSVQVKVVTNDILLDIEAAFVLGCDGARSAVRKCLSIPFEGFTHNVSFVAVNFRYPGILSTGFTDAQFMVDPAENPADANFAVILRTGASDVWRCAYGDDVRYNDEELRARLPSKFKKILPGHPDEGQYELLQVQPYRVHQRAAATFVQGRAILAGDAAHVNNPVGGMGLCTGLLDAHAAAVAIGKGAASDKYGLEQSLGEYNTKRRSAFLELTNPVTTDNLRRLWEAGDEAERELRDLFFERLNQSPEFQRLVQLSGNKMAFGVPGF